MRRKSSILALAAGLALAATAQVQAQDRAPPGRPSMAEMHAHMQAMRAAEERQRADDLRIILRLRPDQDGALQAFLAAEGPPEPGMMHHDGGPGAPPPGPMTTPQRLDEMARRETEHAQMRQRRIAALKAFYAALDPAQQQVFDALARLHEPPHDHPMDPGPRDHGPTDHGSMDHGPMNHGAGGPKG